MSFILGVDFIIFFSHVCFMGSEIDLFSYSICCVYVTNFFQLNQETQRLPLPSIVFAISLATTLSACSLGCSSSNLCKFSRSIHLCPDEKQKLNFHSPEITIAITAIDKSTITNATPDFEYASVDCPCGIEWSCTIEVTCRMGEHVGEEGM